MRISVGDVRLFVEVVGAKLEHRPDGARERPTIVALHGGPGFDHTLTRGPLDTLADEAQLVHFDMRGHGRSEDGPRERWTLETWADDVVRLCDVLGVERPVVIGKSFGAFVGLLYAARHPDHPARLVAVSAVARHLPERCLAVFERLGGPEAAAVAGAAFADDASGDDVARYHELCLPLYSVRPEARMTIGPAIDRPELRRLFSGGEARTMDLRPELGKIRCPVLVVSGVDDPITPLEGAEELAASLPHELVRFEPIAGARHDVSWDVPDRALALVREFALAPEQT